MFFEMEMVKLNGDGFVDDDPFFNGDGGVGDGDGGFDVDAADDGDGDGGLGGLLDRRGRSFSTKLIHSAL